MLHDFVPGQLVRLARAEQIQSVASSAIVEINTVAKKEVLRVVKECKALMLKDKRKTLLARDVQAVIPKRVISIKCVKARVYAPKANENYREPAKNPRQKPHRFKPGTVAKREIKFYSKEPGLHLSKATVERVIRQYLGEDLNLSKEGRDIIRIWLEKYLRGILRDARSVSRTANTNKVAKNPLKGVVSRLIADDVRTAMSLEKHDYRCA